jgi:hypothetical protein
MRVGVAAAIAGGLGTVGAFVACRQLVGIGDDPPGASEVDAGAETADSGIVFAGAACQACVDSNCNAELVACSGTQACTSLATCTGACHGDPTCLAQCANDHPASADSLTPALDACVSAHCSSACGLTCGISSGQLFAPSFADACASCVVTNLCTALGNCESDPVCQAFGWCQRSARTFDTAGACGQSLDGGALDAAIALGNAAYPCLSACGYGETWTCVGQVTWPRDVTTNTLSLVLTVIDGIRGAPLAGVTAKICSPDPACSAPSATDVTDINGMVTLNQSLPTGWINSYVDLSDGGIVPTLFFWDFPLTEPTAYATVFTITPTEYAGMAQQLGVTIDSDAGNAHIVGYDCTLTNADGVNFSISPAGPYPVFYGAGHTVSATQNGTDRGGTAFIFDIPTTTITLTMTPQVTGKPAGEVTFFSRPGGLAEVWALPTP